MYPLWLDIAGRRVVMVGGGAVATRRARGLIDAGADVEVIAPSITDELSGLVDAGLLRWTRRGYLPGDLSGAWFVHTATGVLEVDARVSWDAAAARIWCVNAADRTRSSAWTPAVARGEDGIEVAVTAGGDPRRAMAARDAIAMLLAEGWIAPRRGRMARGGEL